MEKINKKRFSTEQKHEGLVKIPSNEILDKLPESPRL